MGFIISICCTKCGMTVGSLSTWGRQYYYRLPDDTLYQIYPEKGWCWQCGCITDVQEGLSKSKLESGTGVCRRFSEEERAKLLPFVQHMPSLNQCLKCLNFVADEDFYHWRNDEEMGGIKFMRHPGCEGILLKKDSGMHISFEEQEILIPPLWVHQ